MFNKLRFGMLASQLRNYTEGVAAAEAAEADAAEQLDSCEFLRLQREHLRLQAAHDGAQARVSKLREQRLANATHVASMLLTLPATTETEATAKT